MARSARTISPEPGESPQQQRQPEEDGSQVLIWEQLSSALSIYSNGIVLGAGRPIEVCHRILLSAVGKADGQAYATLVGAVVELAPCLNKVLSGLPETIAEAFKAAAALHSSEELGQLLAQAQQLRDCCSSLSGDLGAVVGSPHGVPGLQALMLLDQPQPLDRYHDGMRDAFALGEADGSSNNSATIADMVELLQDCSTHVKGVHKLLQPMSSS